MNERCVLLCFNSNHFIRILTRFLFLQSCLTCTSWFRQGLCTIYYSCIDQGSCAFWKMLWFLCTLHWLILQQLVGTVFERSDITDISLIYLLKLRFPTKVTKFKTISHLILHLPTKRQIKWEIVSNFCGFFRMSELYLHIAQ